MPGAGWRSAARRAFRAGRQLPKAYGMFLRSVVVVVGGMWVGVAGRALADPAPPAPVPAAAAPVTTGFPGALPPSPAADTPPPASPQEPGRNLIFVELGGNGILYTINYDRGLTEDLSVRIGIGHLEEGANPISTGPDEIAAQAATTVPVLMSYVHGHQSHRLELGAGVTVIRHSGTRAMGNQPELPADLSVLATAVIGYRYVPREGGFTYRAGFTPLLSRGGILPWGGLSFGYLF